MKLTALFKGIENILIIFLVLSLGVLLWLNRSTIQEIFSYQTVYEEAWKDLREIFAKEENPTVPMPEVRLVPKDTAEPGGATPTTAYAIYIPKIGVTAPLLFAEQREESYLQELLKQGVVAYPTSAAPGQDGASIILGHSAPAGWPKIRYDWIFSRLNELQKGDIVYLKAGETAYPYTVTKKFILNRGEEIPIERVSDASSVAILLSCWPPGVDYKRIAVQAELIE